MPRWVWWTIGAGALYFLWSGRRRYDPVPETVRRDSYFPGAEDYDVDIEADPELRIPPQGWQLFGSSAFFTEAKRRQTAVMYGSRDVDANIEPIYGRPASGGDLRLVGDLMPNGEYFPKGAKNPLDLSAIDPHWTWR